MKEVNDHNAPDAFKHLDVDFLQSVGKESFDNDLCIFDNLPT